MSPVDHELDLGEFDARFRNDEVGAPAYCPGLLLKIVLLAYSRGLVNSRAIGTACGHNVLFMAVSGEACPRRCRPGSSGRNRRRCRGAPGPSSVSMSTSSCLESTNARRRPTDRIKPEGSLRRRSWHGYRIHRSRAPLRPPARCSRRGH
ncbi:MAG: transposase [Burkholderiales bacterium]|nr:transposase [Burkholderiales bacterium]